MEQDAATELRLGLPGTEKPSKRSSAEAGLAGDLREDVKPAAKAQVVGWPPIRSYRKNTMDATAMAAMKYVKVSMDGAPYLRKIDLKVYKGYRELREALEGMFKCFSPGGNNSSLDVHHASDYAITYEDKDGDLLLVGDVPWDMFASSCKKLRIMKASETRFSSSIAAK